MLMGLIGMLGNWSAILAGILCPNPKIGTVTTGIIYLLGQSAWLCRATVVAFNENLPFIVVKVVFSMAVLWGFFAVYHGMLDDDF